MADQMHFCGGGIYFDDVAFRFTCSDLSLVLGGGTKSFCWRGSFGVFRALGRVNLLSE